MPALVLGIDFAGPSRARDQRRKILAVAAERTGSSRYVVRRTGLNARLLDALPGSTAAELADALLSLRLDRKVRAACEAYETGGRAAQDHDAADAIVAARGTGTGALQPGAPTPASRTCAGRIRAGAGPHHFASHPG